MLKKLFCGLCHKDDAESERQTVNMAKDEPTATAEPEGTKKELKATNSMSTNETVLHETPEALDVKVTALANYVREAQYMIAFTGSGIIPKHEARQYARAYSRTSVHLGGAPESSVLQPVCENDRHQQQLQLQQSHEESDDATSHGVSSHEEEDRKDELDRPAQNHNEHSPGQMPRAFAAFKSLVPSLSHMALVELERVNVLKCLITKNTEGLHRCSGFPPSRLVELHGNFNVERCEQCGTEYFRDYCARNADNKYMHRTGRRCTVPECQGLLDDTIINPGEVVPERTLERAFAQVSEADLCIALGATLRSTPAADVPAAITERGRLVIVNQLQTPLDDDADLVIHAPADEVMALLMQKLGIDVPPFTLRRLVDVRSRVTVNDDQSVSAEVSVQGVDLEGAPASLFTKVQVVYGDGTPQRYAAELTSEPFVHSFPFEWYGGDEQPHVNLCLHFRGVFGEPETTVMHPIPTNIGGMIERAYELVFDPKSGMWSEPRCLCERSEADEAEEQLSADHLMIEA